MADYLAGFYPEWVDKEENPRQIILDLGKMITNRFTFRDTAGWTRSTSRNSSKRT